MVSVNGFDSDDARLSAYALGELDESERASVEALLASNAEARVFVEELRATAAELGRELANEKLPELTADQRAKLEKRAVVPAASVKCNRFVTLRYASAAAITLAFVGSVTWMVHEKQGVETRGAALAVVHPASNGSRSDVESLRGLGYLGDGSKAPQAPADQGSVPRLRALGYAGAGDVPEAIIVGRLGSDPRITVRDLNGFGGEHDFKLEAYDPSAESYDSVAENPFKLSRDDALSTFSIDVDTASYANVRRFLNAGQLPPPGAVRIEELINYFRYDYPQPTGGAPFSVTADVATCPWKQGHLLARIGLRGREVHVLERPASNLVFLIDVSGSMADENKLPLVIRSLRMLIEQLDARDRVAMAVYAGASGLVLDSTLGSNKSALAAALDSLQSGGSTNGGAGIELAYATAREHFVQGGTNRVILCTDGDFNVGVTSQDELVRLIERERESGVFLSVLGFGMGNLKDSTMEKLADKGNGNYAYIDSQNEARKVLVEELGSTLVTIAKDVKIQIEFNPAAVQAWRLIGYENRVLAHQDFNDDRKDAGEIGAGHTVTALYEIVPAGVAFAAPSVDESRYQEPRDTPATAFGDELMFVKLRYKDPEGSESKLLSTAVRNSRVEFDSAPTDFRFATGVAAFGMRLRNSSYVADMPFEWIHNTVMKSLGRDESGYRREFLSLVAIAYKNKK